MSNKKRPQTVAPVKSQESVPAKASDLKTQHSSNWHDWKDLQLDNRWLTDSGEMTSDWTVSA